MRVPILPIIAMTAVTLVSAAFFVRTSDEPVRMQGPLLDKFAAAGRTALLVQKQPSAPRTPLTDVTIINAKPR